MVLFPHNHAGDDHDGRNDKEFGDVMITSIKLCRLSCKSGPDETKRKSEARNKPHDEVRNLSLPCGSNVS